MKRHTYSTWMLLTLMISLAAFSACTHEVSHTESDKANFFGGGRTRTETTVYQNADGSTSSEHSTQTTR